MSSGWNRLAKSLAKSPDIDPAKLADSLDLSALDELIEDTTLEAVASEAATLGLKAVVGAPKSSLVDQVSARAVSAAKQRAAELVGKRVLPDGSIIDNPDARWAITSSTRRMIADAISSGLESNVGRDAIVDLVGAAGAFDDERAATIVDTELRRANSSAAVEGYRGARSVGVNVMKQWLVAAGENVCDECQSAADAGPLDLDDDEFECPAHPGCRCSWSPTVFDSHSE